MGAGRGRRTGIILIVFIIIVLIIAIAALVIMQQPPGGGGPVGEAATPTSVPTPTPPPVINVVVANRDIPRGARLSAADVTIMKWPDLPDAQPPVSSLILETREGAPTLEDLVEGRIARTDILTGQPILDFMLTPGTDPDGFADVGSDAALKIPSGYVAYTIPISRLSAVGFGLREGDHVDVMMSFRFVDVDEDNQTILPNEAFILAQDEGGTITSMQWDFPENQDENGVNGPYGTRFYIFPTTNDAREPGQRPRQATQLVVRNATVLQVGLFPLLDLYQPIVVTAVMPPTAVPAAAAQPGGTPGTPAAPTPQPTPQPNQQPTPTATPIPEPQVVTLVLPRQDALVLKYAFETGAMIDLVLRSALDDDIADVPTDTVTLSYIFDFYNLGIPPRLPVAQDPRIDTFFRPDVLDDFQQQPAQPAQP